jgi:hypothetical protein
LVPGTKDAARQVVPLGVIFLGARPQTPVVPLRGRFWVKTTFLLLFLKNRNTRLVVSNRTSKNVTSNVGLLYEWSGGEVVWRLSLSNIDGIIMHRALAWVGVQMRACRRNCV